MSSDQPQESISRVLRDSLNTLDLKDKRVILETLSEVFINGTVMATDYLLIKGIGVKLFMNNRDVVFRVIVNLLTADQQRNMWLDYDLRKQDNVDENNLLVGMAI